MALKHEKIQQIIDLRVKNNSIGKIVKQTKLARNTVKKYLREYELLDYTYHSYLHAGPPSLFQPPTAQAPDPESQTIQQLASKLLTANTQKEIVEKERDDKTIENKILSHQVNELNMALQKKQETEQILLMEKEKFETQHAEDVKEINHLEQRNEDSKKKLRDYDQLLKSAQKNIIKGIQQIKTVFVTLLAEKEYWVKKCSDLSTALRAYKEKHPSKENNEHALEELEIDQTTIKANHNDEETDNSITIKWPHLVIGGLLVVGGIALIYAHLNKTSAQAICTRTSQRVNPRTRYYTKPGNTISTTGFGVGCGFMVPYSLQKYMNVTQNMNLNPILSHVGSQGDGVTMKTSPAGDSCSGTFSNTNEDNSTSGYSVSFNQQNNMIPPDIYNEGTIVPKPPGNPLDTEVYVNSHFETGGFTPQVHNPVPLHSFPREFPYTLPPYLPVYPLPSDLFVSGTNILVPIKGMGWFQFVVFIEWMFRQLRYRVTRLKLSHDKGGDILIEGYGEKIITQIKHWKENTGTGAMEEVNYARTIYSKTYGFLKARVISYSPFTKPAIKDAPKAEIELWDLGRLITELRNHSIFYPLV